MLPLETRRHSLAHIMAQAVESIYPGVLKTIGPDIDTGFYYDFDFGETVLREEDLAAIEERMKEIIREDQAFERSEVSADEARARESARGNAYKVELIDDLVRDGVTTMSYYRNTRKDGTVAYEDLCRGPHIEKTRMVDPRSFRLERIAGAYWRGDEKNKMLTRVYALAFEDKDALKAYDHMMEEARKRDHRIIGKKLKLFTVSELVGAGLPLLQPNGMIIRKEIEDYLWELHRSRGYLRVWTPHIAKEDLYITSGHATKFGDELFRVRGKEEKFIMKPMNCPHHMQIFADNQWSYRDMPIRYFEPATVYRDEKTGQLSGLMRVRAITQDDGHLFCRPSQIRDEVRTITDIIKEFYTTLGMIDGYWVSLSVRGADKSKYLGTDENWNIAETALEDAAKANDLPYRRIEGEAAFYGPKLDFMFHDAIGRERQLATVQCDFNLPERFSLSYTNEQGESERPVVIHRAISGSLERFMGVMIEHFAGVFPLWLAPRQVIVVTVSDTFRPYAEEVVAALLQSGVRAELDRSDESLGKKIRNAEQNHINYIAVVGEKEQSARSLAVRDYRTKAQTDESLDAFVTRVVDEMKTRKL